MHGTAGRPLAIRVEVTDALPALPAAVEVAAYRIVVEALTNVARHADGAGAVVTLSSDGAWLRIAVLDGGDPGRAWIPGVGLTSMRERAEQLGGTFRAGGGQVEVVLPL
jgi:signal transduction histidine kinase